MGYKLLKSFREVFEGTLYRQRVSTHGDNVSRYFYEDLYDLGRSGAYTKRVQSGLSVVNAQNRRHGIAARRGDGTFGESIPNTDPVSVSGFSVKRGPIATIEIGIEVKIFAKAMIKQFGRVKSDLTDQLSHFKSKGGHPITLGIVAINHAPKYISHEKQKKWITDGSHTYRHPIQEAAKVEERLLAEVASSYDHFLILRFVATNFPPRAFSWINEKKTKLDYGAILARVSQEYQAVYGP